MITETYEGRTLKVKKTRDGGLVGSINGQPMPTRYGVSEQSIIEQFHRDIDFVDREPVNGDRWGAYMYAPGTYELCEEGPHPVAIGGQCRHSYCIARTRAASRPVTAA